MCWETFKLVWITYSTRLGVLYHWDSPFKDESIHKNLLLHSMQGFIDEEEKSQVIGKG